MKTAISNKEVAQVFTSNLSVSEPDIIPRQEMKSPEEILAFEFPPLVARIAKEQAISLKKAHGQFKDMLRFLYVCGAYPKERPFFPPPPIDEAWHTFLLFTKEYAEFCQSSFGRFIHHAPLTSEMREARASGKVKSNRAIEIATAIFGPLSTNWKVPKVKASDCEQSCCPDYDCGD